MTVKKTVSIIIPNYNGARLLQQYLPYTVRAAENAGTVYEIIVVDDASTDGSTSFLEENYPEVKLVKNPVNKGFSHSCNEGMKVAQCELLLFLNSDVKLSPDYFNNLWQYFEKSDTFGVMGRIMSMDEEKIEDSARFPTFMGLRIKASRFFYSNDKDFLIPTTYISGANALVDAKKMRSLQGFDPIFSPFYAEDLDLGLRAWRLGWKCYYDHQAVCFHQVSSTTKSIIARNWVKEVYYRNRFLVHAIHLEGLAFWSWYLHVLLLEVIPKLLIGKFWIWKSFRQFLGHSNEIKKSKQNLSLLMEKNKSSFTLFEVKRIITLEMKGREIIWL